MFWLVLIWRGRLTSGCPILSKLSKLSSYLMHGLASFKQKEMIAVSSIHRRVPGKRQVASKIFHRHMSALRDLVKDKIKSSLKSVPGWKILVLDSESLQVGFRKEFSYRRVARLMALGALCYALAWPGISKDRKIY